MFLLCAGLSREAFIASGVVISCLVDGSRIGVYTKHLFGTSQEMAWGPVAAATGNAFLGAAAGKKAMGAVTMKGIRHLVAVLLIVVGASLAGRFL